MKKQFIYEIGMSVLACAAVIFAIIDLKKGLAPFLQLIDNIIFVIFVFDYLIRLILSKEKRLFLKENLWDLIAIIPFSSAFRIFRVAKLARLVRITKLAKMTKITKLSRLFAFSFRLIDKLRTFLDTNGFKYVLSITAIFIILGGIAIHFAEGMSLSDGIWWSFVTATTVGYGDISPSTSPGRLVAMILMLVGIGLIGSLTSTITSFFLKRTPGKSVADETLDHIISRIKNIKSLSDKDIDDICDILKTLNK